MVYFGKIKNTDNEWGFGIYPTNFDSFVEIDEAEHMKIINKANNEGKIIKADEQGNPILVDPPPPPEKEVKRHRLIELECYMRETDWYAIRFAETGKNIPEEIKTKRQQAREEISILRETLKTN